MNHDTANNSTHQDPPTPAADVAPQHGQGPLRRKVRVEVAGVTGPHVNWEDVMDFRISNVPANAKIEVIVPGYPTFHIKRGLAGFGVRCDSDEAFEFVSGELLFSEVGPGPNPRPVKDA